MRDCIFRQTQWEHRFDSHVAPINMLVDILRKQSSMDSVPYIPPMYGGVHAGLLSVMRDPGPKTQGINNGSGFICMENDDPTAEAVCNYFSAVNISADTIVPWNIYPWYINRKPNSRELELGIEPLKLLINMLPDLKVVMLHGGDAHKGWNMLMARNREISSLGLLVIKTYHTSRKAFWHKDPLVREQRKTDLKASFAKAKSYLDCH